MLDINTLLVIGINYQDEFRSLGLSHDRQLTDIEEDKEDELRTKYCEQSRQLIRITPLEDLVGFLDSTDPKQWCGINIQKIRGPDRYDLLINPFFFSILSDDNNPASAYLKIGFMDTTASVEDLSILKSERISALYTKLKAVNATYQ